MHLLREAVKGPAAPSCKVFHCPAEACHTGPTHRSTWAGSHQHRTDDLTDMIVDNCVTPTDYCVYDYSLFINKYC